MSGFVTWQSALFAMSDGPIADDNDQMWVEPWKRSLIQP